MSFCFVTLNLTVGFILMIIPIVILKPVKMDLDDGPGGGEVTLVIRVRLFFLFISFPFFKCRHTPLLANYHRYLPPPTLCVCFLGEFVLCKVPSSWRTLSASRATNVFSSYVLRASSLPRSLDHALVEQLEAKCNSSGALIPPNPHTHIHAVARKKNKLKNINLFPHFCLFRFLYWREKKKNYGKGNENEKENGIRGKKIKERE